LNCRNAAYLLVEDDLSLSALVSAEPVEPAPAAPLGLELGPEGAELDDEDAPPLAGLFVVSLELEELELGELGALGEVVEPDEDAEPDIEPDGEVLDPEGDVPRSLERLQPVTTAVPSARVTASAKVESLMRPPW
jgi:hypothetical protein